MINVRGVRALLAVLMAAALLVGVAPTASAHPQSGHRTERVLAEFWQALLSKTRSEARPTICLHFGHRLLTPFILGYEDETKPPVTHIECDARAGERLFMTGYTDAEVSAGDPGWTPESLRATAIERVNPAPPAATYDGHPLDLPLVVTKLTKAHLAEDDLIGTADRQTFFVAAAWVTTIRLRPGRHTVLITGADGVVYTTTLHVSC